MKKRVMFLLAAFSVAAGSLPAVEVDFVTYVKRLNLEVLDFVPGFKITSDADFEMIKKSCTRLTRKHEKALDNHKTVEAYEKARLVEAYEKAMANYEAVKDNEKLIIEYIDYALETKNVRDLTKLFSSLDEFGMTGLHVIARQPYSLDVLRKLLVVYEKCTDLKINALDNDGRSAIFYSVLAEEKATEMFDLLHEKGAGLFIVDRTNSTPLKYAENQLKKVRCYYYEDPVSCSFRNEADGIIEHIKETIVADRRKEAGMNKVA